MDCNIYHLELIAIGKSKKNKKTPEKEKTTDTPEITRNRRAVLAYNYNVSAIPCTNGYRNRCDRWKSADFWRLWSIHGDFGGDLDVLSLGAGGLDVLSLGSLDLDAAGGIFFLKVNLITASDFSTGIQ